MLFNLQTENLQKVIILHKTSKPESLVGSYGPVSLTSCLGKLLEKAEPDNQSNWAKYSKKFNNQQNGFKKYRSKKENLFKLFETIKFDFQKAHPATGIFLDVEKAFDQVWVKGFLFELTPMGLNRKVIR